MDKKYKYFLSGGNDRGFAFLGTQVKHPSEADLIVFTGGEDINPALYNEPVGKYTSFSKQRDAYEISLYNKFIDTPKLGVCRGHQLLSVLAGASLIQHVTKHNSTHKMITYNGVEFDVTSCHHQMVNLAKLNNMEDYFLIGYADSLSTTYLNGIDVEITSGAGGQMCHKILKEPEMVYFPATKAITFQGHPEWMGAMKGQQYVYDWVVRLIEGEVESFLCRNFGAVKKSLIDSDSNDIYDEVFNMYQ